MSSTNSFAQLKHKPAHKSRVCFMLARLGHLTSLRGFAPVEELFIVDKDLASLVNDPYLFPSLSIRFPSCSWVVAYFGVVVDGFGERLKLHRFALVEHLVESASLSRVQGDALYHGCLRAGSYEAWWVPRSKFARRKLSEVSRCGRRASGPLRDLFQACLWVLDPSARQTNPDVAYDALEVLSYKSCRTRRRSDGRSETRLLVPKARWMQQEMGSRTWWMR